MRTNRRLARYGPVKYNTIGRLLSDGRVSIDHTHPQYKDKRFASGINAHNGAYYYSKEICKNIIPLVKTTRNWITINVDGVGVDHSIVFVHNNLNPEKYEWLRVYKDIVLVCGVQETVQKVAHIGRAIYLPLSIDVAEVMEYARPKTKDAAFVGRADKLNIPGVKLPEGIDYIAGLPRAELLAAMAAYKRVYAVGRVALEAKALGCEVLAYDPRYPDPDRWVVLDNKAAAEILQKELDQIDGVEE